jgi:cytochrome b561
MHPRKINLMRNANGLIEFQTKRQLESIMAAPRDYSRMQVFLHWAIAVLIVVQLTINADMQQAFAQRLTMGTVPENFGAWFHAVVGILVLVLAIVRLVLRGIRGVPDPDRGIHPLLQFLGHSVHLLLYGFLFIMPISGALAWLFGIETAGVIHELGRLILIPAIFLHIGGAIFEELALRNPVLKRMLEPGRH